MKKYLAAMAIIAFFMLSAAKAQLISYTGNFAPVGPTTYGTASASTSVNVTSSGLTDDVVVTSPAGFEISINGFTYSNSIGVPAVAGTANFSVYIRLSATANASAIPYTGDVNISSTGASTLAIHVPAGIINKAPLTVTTDDVIKPYGDVLLDYTGSGVYKVVAGTLKNGNTLSTVTIVYGTGYNAGAAVGTYTGSVGVTQLTGSNGFLIGNYNVIYQNANIIIKPVNLAIKAKDTIKPYGTALVNGSSASAFTATGLKNLETIGSVNVTYGAGAAAIAAVNRYPLSVKVNSPTGGNFSASNYIISFTDADVVVQPAPLSITADNQSRLFGDANPTLTYSYNDFVNGEDKSQLTALPVISTTATPTSPAGPYPISITGAAANNYSITYNNAILIVNALPLFTLIIPNTFTPNGDGINDTWVFDKILPNNSTVEIFSRNGSIIFSSIGYGIPWDGTYQGAKLPAGTYYYIIDFKNGQKPLGGSVSIIR
jgi:gliding motility-associated-like protein